MTHKSPPRYRRTCCAAIAGLSAALSSLPAQPVEEEEDERYVELMRPETRLRPETRQVLTLYGKRGPGAIDAGTGTLTLRATEIPGRQVMELRGIYLTLIE